jgi:hypothetical protein
VACRGSSFPFFRNIIWAFFPAGGVYKKYTPVSCFAYSCFGDRLQSFRDGDDAFRATNRNRENDFDSAGFPRPDDDHNPRYSAGFSHPDGDLNLPLSSVYLPYPYRHTDKMFTEADRCHFYKYPDLRSQCRCPAAYRL